MLISDEYTNSVKRRAMMEKRMRKEDGIAAAVPPPQLQGPANADVTLIGWGSTYGVIDEACELLRDAGISANHLPIRWLVPLHGDAILDLLRARGTPSSSRTTSAASSPAICAAKPALFPTDTFASTTESRSCRTTSWKQSRNSLRARRISLCPPTKSWFRHTARAIDILSISRRTKDGD